jgi:hypothetical protein
MNFIDSENEKVFVKLLTKNKIINGIRGHVKRSSDNMNQPHTSFVNQLIKRQNKEEIKFQYTALREMVRANVNTSKNTPKLIYHGVDAIPIIPLSHQVRFRNSPSKTPNLTRRNIGTSNLKVSHSMQSFGHLKNNEDIINLKINPRFIKSRFTSQKGSEQSLELKQSR